MNRIKSIIERFDDNVCNLYLVKNSDGQYVVTDWYGEITIYPYNVIDRKNTVHVQFFGLDGRMWYGRNRKGSQKLVCKRYARQAKPTVLAAMLNCLNAYDNTKRWSVVPVSNYRHLVQYRYTYDINIRQPYNGSIEDCTEYITKIFAEQFPDYPIDNLKV